MNNITVALIKALLNSHFRDRKKVELWLNTKNPNLGEVTPNYMISIGREEKLLQFVSSCFKENKRA